jgi:hypothetical protein
MLIKGDDDMPIKREIVGDTLILEGKHINLKRESEEYDIEKAHGNLLNCKFVPNNDATRMFMSVNFSKAAVPMIHPDYPIISSTYNRDMNEYNFYKKKKPEEEDPPVDEEPPTDEDPPVDEEPPTDEENPPTDNEEETPEGGEEGSEEEGSPAQPEKVEPIDQRKVLALFNNYVELYNTVRQLANNVIDLITSTTADQKGSILKFRDEILLTREQLENVISQKFTDVNYVTFEALHQKFLDRVDELVEDFSSRVSAKDGKQTK